MEEDLAFNTNMYTGPVTYLDTEPVTNLDVPAEVVGTSTPPKHDEGPSTKFVLIDESNIKEVQNKLITRSNPDECVLNIDVTTHFTTDQVFESRSDLIHWCQEVGRKVMTVVVITKSEYSVVGRKPRLNLGCERGGVFRDHRKKSDLKDKKIKRTGTKRCGCPFALRGVKLNEGDQWKLEVQCGIHNHSIARSSIGHSYAGRLSQEEKQILIEMSKSGVKPREVLTTIKERNKKNVSTMSTIYNARAKLKISKMEGRIAMQQLLTFLVDNQCVEWHKRDEETNEVKDIFWAHPESVQLAKCFPSVLMIDCTYRTNRFRIPIFEIIGVTSAGKTFCIAFVFMEAEKEDNYVWALSRLKSIFDPKSLPGVFVTERELTLMKGITTVFPEARHLLCTLQISRNIMTHCKKHFDSNHEFDKFLDDWTCLIKSESEVEFLDRLAAFEIAWDKFPLCLTYLKDHWLSQYKEHFVSTWTNLVKHHGITNINRAGNAHSKLKRYLRFSRGNFTTVWVEMHNMITGEIAGVKASFENSLVIIEHFHQFDILKEVKDVVSHLALDLIVAEIFRSQSIGTDAKACRCVLRHTHGLPCAHEIAQLAQEGQPIPSSSIDSQCKKLLAIPTPEIQSDLHYELEMQQLIKSWEESNDEQRRRLLKKIKELANSATTWLDESVSVTEGRPKKLSKSSP